MEHFLGYSGKDKKGVTHHAGDSGYVSCQPRQQGRGQLVATTAAPEAGLCTAVPAARAYSVQGLCGGEGRPSSRVPAAAAQDDRVAPREGTAEVSQEGSNNSIL